jgi:hypothetical protein
MVRLTREETEIEAKWLSVWRAPGEMAERIESLMDCLGTADLFNQPGLEWVRDAWGAAKFGVLRNASSVRLVTEAWPDFEVRVDGRVQAFEFTEADLEGRRRGAEYRDASEGVEDDPFEEWIERAKQIPARLRDAAGRKAAKRYPASASLLIYLNINEYGIRQAEIEACFVPSTDRARDAFKSVWILWKQRVYEVWRDGRVSLGL